MLQSFTYKGKNLGFVDESGKKTFPPIYDDVLDEINTSDAIENSKTTINQLADVKNKFQNIDDNLNPAVPMALGVCIPALTYLILHSSNADYIYVGRDLQHFAMHNGVVLSFSEYVTLLAAQIGVSVGTLFTAVEAVYKSYLKKSITKISDEITYYQMVLGALRKHAESIGMKPDYSNDKVKRLVRIKNDSEDRKD